MAARAYDSQLFQQVEELGYVVRLDGNFSVLASRVFKGKQMTKQNHEFIAAQAENMFTRRSPSLVTGPIASFRASIQFVS